jgi:predicted hydrocarbon binding protein
MTEQTTLTEQALEWMFGAQADHFDLNEGTIIGVTEKVIYLTSDLIIGLHEMLEYEAGEAWSLIFYKSGYLWGKREIIRLQKELRIAAQQELDALPVSGFLQLVETYFARHGWGKVKLYLDDAEQYGILRASLRNSLFDENIPNTGGPVNHMIAGLLRAFFEHISQANLDCAEISWPTPGGQSHSDFLISASSRIEQIQSYISNAPLPLEEALGRLRVA